MTLGNSAPAFRLALMLAAGSDQVARIVRQEKPAGKCESLQNRRL